jgi:calcium-dependent protein kinase
LCCVSAGQKFRGVAGSCYYIAPEVLSGEYSAEADMWSVGVIVYILLAGVLPFGGATDRMVLREIREGRLRFPSDPWNTISPAAKDLVRGLLCRDVSSRLTPQQALSKC